jgi:hypothetical protein
MVCTTAMGSKQELTERLSMIETEMHAFSAQLETRVARKAELQHTLTEVSNQITENEVLLVDNSQNESVFDCHHYWIKLLLFGPVAVFTSKTHFL